MSAGHSPPRRVNPRREDEQEQDEGEAGLGDEPGALLPPGRRRGRGSVRQTPRTHAPSSHVRGKSAPAGVSPVGDRLPSIIRQRERKKKKKNKDWKSGSVELPSARR